MICSISQRVNVITETGISISLRPAPLYMGNFHTILIIWWMRPQRLGYRQDFRINTMGNETKAIPASIICTHSTSHLTLLLEIYHRLTTGVQSALMPTIAGRLFKRQTTPVSFKSMTFFNSSAPLVAHSTLKVSQRSGTTQSPPTSCSICNGNSTRFPLKRKCKEK